MDTPPSHRYPVEGRTAASVSDAEQPGDLPKTSEEQQTEPRGWGYSDLFYLLLFSIPSFFLIAVVCVAALYGLNVTLEWNLSLEDPQVQAPLMIVIQLLWWAAILAYLYVVITVKYGLPFLKSIGWKPVREPPAVYLAGGVLMAVGVAAASYLLPKPEGRLPIEALLEDPVAVVLLAAFGVLLAPALEEVVFRGFVFLVIERSHGAGMAVLVTSVIFSLVHGMQYGWRWQNLLLLLAVGAVLGSIRARTSSVVPSTLAHAAYNATLFAALFAASQQVGKM